MKPRVLVAIPLKKEMHPYLKKNCIEHATELIPANPNYDIVLHLDYTEIPKLPTDTRPWSKVTRIRNEIIESVNLDKYDYVFWVDADVVDYPRNILTKLIEVNHTGISAPQVLIEQTNQWYDWAAFVMKDRSHIEPENRGRIWGRNLQHPHPYWWEYGGEGCEIDPMKAPPRGKVCDYINGQSIVEVDCVGTIYTMPVDIYQTGVRHEDHPAFTDHFPICEKAIEMGKKVTVNRDVSAYHAVLPNYGEQWHIWPIIAMTLIWNLMA